MGLVPGEPKVGIVTLRRDVHMGTTAGPVPAATIAAGEHSTASMVSIGPLLPASGISVMPLLYSLVDAIAADTVTRFKVRCLHLVFGRQSVDK